MKFARRFPPAPLVLSTLTTILLLPAPCQARLEAVATREANGDIHLKWPGRQGFQYQVERSSDLIGWSGIGFTLYGQSDSDPTDVSSWMSLRVYAPPYQGGNQAEPPAVPGYMFFLNRDGDHTLVSWNSAVTGNGLVSAYLDQDWRFQVVPDADSLLLLQPISIGNNGTPYQLILWPMDGQALPVPLPGAVPPEVEDQDRLALLTGGHADVLAYLQNPPATPPVPAVENGTGTREFFRVREWSSDLDEDGIFDSHEFILGLSPAAADTDGDGVEDPWDGLSNSLVVAEFQASNFATITDEDGDYEDWVEILNPTTSPVSLDGWRLTDQPGGEPGDQPNLEMWTFPNGITLQPGQSLLIWASSKDRAVPGLPLHANFKLDANDEGIGLVNAQGALVDSYRWTSPQVENRSAGWGIDNLVGPADGRTRKLRYFGEPTPGALNKTSAFIGVCGKPVLSVDGGIFSDTSFPVTVSTLTEGTIHITTDFTVPDEHSPVYSEPITVDGTTIVRARVLAPDCFPSPVATASYLFKEDVLGTAAQGQLPTDHQVRPDGYPDLTSEAPYLIDYAMDPLFIQADRNTMVAELSALPTVSIVLPVCDFFDDAAGGVYANSSISEQDNQDPRNNKWRRLASIEYIGEDNSQWAQETGKLSIAGGSSIRPSTTPKHGMKIEFDGKVSSNPEGMMTFDHAPFPGSKLSKMGTLMLRSPTQDSWPLRWSGWRREEASYVKESWARATHAAMGHNIAHRRWVHLYIDGLYWGLYGFGERVNQDFMRSYDHAEAEYDVRKHSEAEDGDLIAWSDMLARATAAGADPGDAEKWTALTEMIDLENYIDYLMVNMYAHNTDWPSNNWRAARRKDLDDRSDPDNVIYASGADAQRFQFFIWDAESSMRQSNVAADRTGVTSGVAQVHGVLLAHPAYQQLWKDRVALHFDQPNGAFGLSEEVHQASMRFDDEAHLFAAGIHCELARWGDGAITPAYTRADWLINTSARSGWLKTRRAHFLSHLQARGLAD